MPTLVGRFTVLRRIGRGGFADVYLGQDPETGARVALKVLRDDIDPRVREQVLTRFLAEEAIARAVDHPAVVRILETSPRGENPCFLAMDYVDGLPFCEHFARLRAFEPLDSKRPAKLAVRAEVIRLGHQVARAMSAAHSRGIVHRDLKPDNVLLVSEGGTTHAQILDFGIAKAPPELFSLERSAAVTRYYTELGTVMGSPPYMAPEQNGSAHTVSGKADVFALGVMLLVALLELDADALETGRERLAFPADFNRVVLGAGLPDPVRELLRAMVDEQPELRPSMQEVALRLQRAARNNERFGAAVEHWLRHGRVPRAGELLDLARYGERAPNLTDDELAFLRRAPLDKLAQVRSRTRILSALLATGLCGLAVASVFGTARAVPSWAANPSAKPDAPRSAEPSPPALALAHSASESSQALAAAQKAERSWRERELHKDAEHQATLRQLELKASEQRRGREQTQRLLERAEAELAKAKLATSECRTEFEQERDALAECRQGVETGLVQLVESSERLRLCTRSLREQSQSLRLPQADETTLD